MLAYTTATQTGAGTGTAIRTSRSKTDNDKYTLLLVLTGTVNADVEFAIEEDLGTTNWIQHAVLNGKTSSAASDLLSPASGFRVVVNSGSGTATLKVLQGNN